MTRIATATTHPIARALLCALALSLLAPAAARAEIIDFDPAEGDGPEIVEQDALDLMDALGGAEFPYMVSPISPDGAHVVADFGSGPAIVALGSGEETPFDNEPDGFSPYGPFVWLDEATLGQISQTVEEVSEDEPPIIRYFKTTIDVGTGAVTTEELTALADLGGSLVSSSKQLDRLLVMLDPEGGPFLPPTREVTVGMPDDYEPHRRLLPDAVAERGALPGAIGTLPLGTMTVQQAATRLVLVSPEEGSVTELTTLPAGTALAGMAWHPSGERVALGTIVPLAWDGDRSRDNEPSNEPREPSLEQPAVQEALGRLAPASNPLLASSAIRVYAAGDGSETAALQNAAMPEGLIAGFDWSPSGEHALLALALPSQPEGREHPSYAFNDGMRYVLLGGETLEVARALEGPGLDALGSAVFFVDEATLVAATPAGVDTRLHRIDAATGEVEAAWTRPGAIWQMGGGGGRIAFSHTTVDQPFELWTADAADVEGTAAPLTALNEAIAEASHLTTHPVTWTTDDGTELSGVLVMHEESGYPPAEPSPLVVWQEGGPGPQMANAWGTSVEGPYSVLPHFGLPVLIVNAAGRASNDPAFFRSMADGTNFGQLDIDQIKAGVDALAARGIVDPDRVGITGCSYGGYFALQSIRRHPDAYAAANAQCSLTDLFEEFTYGYAPVVAHLMGRAPMADPAEYIADSPLYGAKDVKTPTLLFHGREDFLPFQLINNYHDQLELSGTPVQFFRVAGEGHGLGYEQSQRYAAQLQLAWFREHLGVPDDWEPDPDVREDETVRIFMPMAVAAAPVVEAAP